MNQPVIERDIPFLLQEIITSILIRLLIRCQCVCRYWTNVVVCAYKLDREMQVFEVRNEPFLGSVRRSGIVDSCNGLLYFTGNNYSIYLWNPAIRDFRWVPKAINWFESDNDYLGFGYSEIVNDYKIVKIYVSESDDNQVNLVEVYSPRIGSWKEVDCDSLDGVAISSNGFNANGNRAIFWFGLKLVVEEDGEGDTDFIVSFDIAMEVFTLILAPAASIYFIYDNGFAIYDNKLAILSHTLSENFDSSLVELWVMEDDWDWDWNKIFTSRPHPGLRLLPVTIWKNEIVCNATELPEIFTQSKTKVKNAEQQTAILLE